ncbi:glycosyltransferase family 2 protein [Candidatus Daviesbacteria bacterium]|nr:glycosyltransferase family 2 protein [Candidatus Daviesbacteria bacterium]
MKIALITVNYNGKKDTLELLNSLKQLHTTNYELITIVVDNGSDDGLVSKLVKDYPEVVVLQNGVNKGFGGGFNRGLEYGLIWGADYFLILNNDTLINDKDLVNKLIETTKLDDRIGLVAPKILFAPGFEFHKDRYKKDDFGKVIWYAGGSFDHDNLLSHQRGINEVDSGKYDLVEEVDFANATCLLIKREVLEKVGLFNEEYFAYFEDNEFSFRVSKAGFKKFYNGKASIYHKVSQTAGIGSPITDYFHTRNRLYLGMKYAKLRTQLAVLRQALKFLFFGRHAQRRGVLDFILGVKGGIPEVTKEPEKFEFPYKLSIVIVNYNTANLTKKLLQSIFTHPMPCMGTEVLVLDNGSKDNCKEVIKEFLPKIKYLENQENEGFSKGYNKLIRYSQGEYFLMLNSDIEVLENSLAEIVKWEDEFQAEAVLGGKLVFPDKSKQDSAFHLPTIWGAFKEYFLAQKGSYFMYEPKGEKPSKVEGLVMACFLIPHQIINKVGLLDEGTFIFFEDIEYCRRLKKMGVPIYFVPSAKFIHHHGASTKKIGQEKAMALLQKSVFSYYLGFKNWSKIGQS